ncbi:NUC189-domain-containing protein [Sistotremastrum niveocremeum HHB9708]|uniref:NUC189-domain-containing protein n=1 Tax=Sistotremastrum niveocremeum HHB9708 TaxID=1314777 RepID=A0A164UI22_9AGAM|nr:NUC189-domain-containing protein [Sistotremastrum niveocremeum HHB9708]
MSVSSKKTKNSKQTTPRSRPASTTLLSNPVDNGSSRHQISSFSPDAALFAHVSLAVDKDRLRIFSAVSGQPVTEHIPDASHINGLSWGHLLASDSSEIAAVEDVEALRTKKRKKKSANAESSPSVPLKTTVVALALSSGRIEIFSPSHGRVLRTLSNPTHKAAVTAVRMQNRSQEGLDVSLVWSSNSEGGIHLWNASSGALLRTWQGTDGAQFSALALKPDSGDEEPSILAGSSSIYLLATPLPGSTNSAPDSLPLKSLAKVTGHVSAIQKLEWVPSASPSLFISTANEDRFVNVWDISVPASGETVASVTLDSEVRDAAVGQLEGERRHLLTVSAKGVVAVFDLPPTLRAASSASKTNSHTKLIPQSVAMITSPGPQSLVPISASFVVDRPGIIRIASRLSDVKTIFNDVRYLEENGDFIAEIVVSRDDINLILARDDKNSKGSVSKRYVEGEGLKAVTGIELGQDNQHDAVATPDGALDVDMAELSLGQRLSALNGTTSQPQDASSMDEDEAPQTGSSNNKRKKRANTVVIPVNSLTRTLIQALHSSDSRLLESCLQHSDPTVIQNTVIRLPPQLAVPLLSACVERLGRGPRAGKGGGGGASAQRGTVLVAWVKAVLVVHSGHLMTMPDLVARLASLHSTLTTRLTLQDRLLSLSGRLDLVLSQIELRSSTLAAPLTTVRKPKQPKASSEPKVSKYVEEESSSEDDDEARMQVEVEKGDDEGSVEDVELGAASDEEIRDEGDEDGDAGSAIDGEEEESESDEGDQDDDDDDDEEGDEPDRKGMNGFIDDEAEEWSQEEDEEDDDSE